VENLRERFFITNSGYFREEMGTNEATDSSSFLSERQKRKFYWNKSSGAGYA